MAGVVAALLLAGCNSPSEGPAGDGSQGGTPLAGSCVLYARAVSGIDLRGDAYTWWDGAAGRYLRGQVPEPGAVLVLSRTDRLQRGHVAVVRQVLDDRDILVDHANWLPGQIVTGMQVRDVSPDNDWTRLRFLNRQAGVFGSVYPADGFIYQMLPLPALSALPNGESGELRAQLAVQ